MPYDLFISYSRKDNVNNRVTELKNQIEKDYFEFSREELLCFFDTEEIKGMEDWQHRLLQGLKDSHLMLVILSPHYLNSPYCEWEITEYLKYEYSRGVQGDGVAQVYFMEIPGIDDDSFRAKAAAWLEKVSRRQRIDLRPWYDEGAASLQKLDVKKHLDELRESLRKRITRMRSIAEVPGNLPAPNPRFVGREREMALIHAATGLGKLGVVTAVHGVGGLGKTAIAFQYAYAYANFYPGGRWYIGCAGETSLAPAIKRLDADLNVTFSEDEKKNDIRGAKRILNELKELALKGAEAANEKIKTSGTEKESVKPALLLILDNVDHPALIQPPGTDLISGKEWLKTLVTTRLGPDELGDDETAQTLLTIDELPFDDAVSLIESYQPGGRFKNEQEKEKAGEIVKFLDGFTLAVEVAALYLFERKGLVSCADFLEVLKIKGIDFAGERTKKQLSHTKLVSATLSPTLDALSSEEMLILNYAALLPPDSIPLPWIKKLVVKDYPDLGEEEMAGIDNPWISTINHLLSLRLLQVVDTEEQIPRLIKMHRLISENVRKKQAESINRYQDSLTDSLKTRCNELEHNWYKHQWEIMPLVAYANNLLDNNNHKSAKFIRSLCQWLTAYDDGKYSEPILRKTLSFLEIYPSEDYLDKSVTLSNLGWALVDLSRYEEAEKYLREALEIEESVENPDNHALVVRYFNLSKCLIFQGNFLVAKQYAEKALALSETEDGKEHYKTTLCIHSLAVIEHNLGNLNEAKKLMIQVLASDIKTYGHGHPTIAITQSNLANVLQDLGELQEAKHLHRQALESDMKSFESGHPSIAKRQSNLAQVLKDLGELQEAKQLLKQALDSIISSQGPDYPSIATFKSNLALVFRDLGELYEAKQLLRQALQLALKTYPNSHLEIAKIKFNLVTVLQRLGDLEEAIDLLRQVLDIQLNSLPKGHRTIRVSYTFLANFLEQAGQFSKAREIMMQSMEHEPEVATQTELRQRAIKYYQLKDYEKANEILLKLLSEGFEPASIYHHLARICIITDGFTEAKEYIENGWALRKEVKLYIVARFLWFKTLMGFIENTPTQNFIAQLKTVLQEDDAFMFWTMQPVLDHIKPKITEHQHALLTTLVDAMSNKLNLDKLDEFPEWKNAEAKEIE